MSPFHHIVHLLLSLATIRSALFGGVFILQIDRGVAARVWNPSAAPSLAPSNGSEANQLFRRSGRFHERVEEDSESDEYLSNWDHYSRTGKRRLDALLEKAIIPSQDKPIAYDYNDQNAPYYIRTTQEFTVEQNIADSAADKTYGHKLGSYWLSIFSDLGLNKAIKFKYSEVYVKGTGVDGDSKQDDMVISGLTSMPSDLHSPGVFILTSARLQGDSIRVLAEKDIYLSDLVRAMVQEARGGPDASVADIQCLFQDNIDSRESFGILDEVPANFKNEASRVSDRRLELDLFSGDRFEKDWVTALVGMANGEIFARLLEESFQAFDKKLINIVDIWYIKRTQGVAANAVMAFILRSRPWGTEEVLTQRQYLAMGKARLDALDAKVGEPNSNKPNTVSFTLLENHEDDNSDNDDDDDDDLDDDDDIIWMPKSLAESKAAEPLPYYIQLEKEVSMTDYMYDTSEPYWKTIFGETELNLETLFTQIAVFVREAEDDGGDQELMTGLMSKPSSSHRYGVFIFDGVFVSSRAQSILKELNKNISDLLLEMMAVARGYHENKREVRVADSSFTDVEYFFVNEVQNEGTQKMIQNALRDEKGKGKWVLTQKSDRFNRLLLDAHSSDSDEKKWATTLVGTRNGKMFARLLEENFGVFGKRIKSVRAWEERKKRPSDDYDVEPIMLFKLAA